MARGINKAILIGNLGADPEMRYTPTNNNPVVTVNIATSSGWRDKQTGEMQERTEWHRVVFFNRLAEIVGEYLKKGSKIYVEGSLRTRKWTDKNGVDRYTTEVIANEMQMLDSRGSSGASNTNQQTASTHDDQPAATETTSTSSNAGTGHQDLEDEIPF